MFESENNAISSSRSSSLKIQATSYGARITGAKAGERALVFTEDGVMQQSVSIKDQQTDIRLQKEGLYIIKVEDKVMKLRH